MKNYMRIWNERSKQLQILLFDRLILCSWEQHCRDNIPVNLFHGFKENGQAVVKSQGRSQVKLLPNFKGEGQQFPRTFSVTRDNNLILDKNMWHISTVIFLQ